MASLVLAVRFLTIVPIAGREAEGPGALGRAAWWFPVVGLGLGLALVAIDRVLLLAFPPLLTALLVLTSWKVATGGIHLDGLADCLDGLAGADAERRLAIMRDSRVGVFGAVGLILYFMIAAVALADIPVATGSSILLAAPVVGRLAPLLVGAWFGPATPEHGAGAWFLRTVPRAAGPAHLAAVLALAGWLLGPWGAGMAVGALAVVFAWSAVLGRRLSGLTGDVLGAGVELGELAFVLAGASCVHLGRI